MHCVRAVRWHTLYKHKISPRTERTSMYGKLQEWAYNFEATLRRSTAYASKWGRQPFSWTKNVPGAFPNLSLFLGEKSRHTERTMTNANLPKTKNNDFQTMSERASAHVPANVKLSLNFPIHWANSSCSMTGP